MDLEGVDTRCCFQPAPSHHASRATPSDYICNGNWFFAAEPEESTLAYVMERIGQDKLIFASDYPRWDGMFPYVVSTIRGRADLSDLSDEAKRKFLGGNAARLYGWA